MVKRLIIFILIGLNLQISTAQAANSITVFAASSLTESFSQLGKRFEAAHPGVKVRFSFLTSSTLATQIKIGRAHV